MWKFKNKRKSPKEVTESTTAIVTKQVAETNDDSDDDADDDEEGEGEGDENNIDTSSSNDTIEKVDAFYEVSSGSSIENQVNHDDDSGEEDNNKYQNDTENIDIDSNQIDSFLARELNALSFEQRESINEEIHGINVSQIYVDKVKEIEETPELLNKSFVKLQIELNKLQPNSFAYNRCQQLYGDATTNTTTATTNENVVGNKDGRKSYINTNEFRIIFLRCELFDTTKAARRFVNYVELMYELYGDVGIQRRIILDDLSTEERRILELGYSQILPGRDRAGRKIMVHIAFNSTNEYTAKSRIRVLFYVQMSVLNDIETQRKGALFIAWFQNVNIFADFMVRGKTFSSGKSQPYRIGAVHICIPEELGEHDNYTKMSAISSGGGSLDISSTKSSNSSQSATPVNVIKSMVAVSIGSKMRSKLRIHTGSALECLYALQSFGIPSNQIPLVIGSTSNKKRRRRNKTKRNDSFVCEDNTYSNLKLNNHTQWLQLCQLKESNIKLYGKEWKYYGGYDQQQIIECPNHSDVTGGRGMDVMNQPGNTALRNIVISKLDEYINMKSNGEKVKLTLDVVHLLKNKYGARFLTKETTETNGNLGCWVEISNKEARLKVRLAFRDKSRNQQSRQNKMIQSMMKMPSVDDHIDNNNTSNNNNEAGANNASNNITKEKNKFSTNVQKRHEQLISLTAAPTMHSPINVSPSTSLSMLARTASLVLERQKNNNTNSDCHQQIQQQVEENAYSNTSLFLNLTGNGGGSICNPTGKKRQLQTKSCLSCFDCVNNY